MTMERLNEKIILGAIFGHGSLVSPAWFIWKGRKIRVTGTNYHWTERKGTDILHHFAVTDGADSYELVLDASRMVWRLCGVSVNP